MSKLTKAARGKPCTIRLQGCDGGGETTVGAHYRSVRFGAGVGKKPHDLLCADACANCHDIIDGRKYTNIPKIERQIAHLEGVLETILRRAEEGLITWN